MVVTSDDIRHVAALAKIAVTDEQTKSLQQELNAIVGYVTLLDKVDLSGLAHTYQVTGLKNVQRPDQIIDYGVSQAELLKNAPEQQDNQIKVPKVLVN